MRCADCGHHLTEPRWRVCLRCRNARIGQGVRFAWARRRAKLPTKEGRAFVRRVARTNPTLSMRVAKARGSTT